MTSTHSGPPPTTNEYEMDDSKLKYDQTMDGQVVEPVSDQLDNVGGFEVDEAESRRVLRKIDWHLMPLLCVVYGLQFCLFLDLRESHADYSVYLAALDLGYLVGEFPTSYLLARLPIAKTTALSVLFSLCDYTLISPTTHTSFLGFLEAGITPAFTIITSQWYRKHEQGTRTGIWFSCNALSLTLGAFIAYGFAEADLSGDLALPGWQVIFIFMGCLTTGMGVVLALFLPDTPLTARFLTAREKEVAIERIRSNQQSVGNHDYKLYQVKEAFTDPMTWLYSLYAIALNIPNGAFTK
ncbi:hypothetical protein QFC20_002294 [Naganishia adeliensis]|uniref:Uncharacterized protein n=1 Tax=Naganishia adeliensis TaxID=92952 RepID=A0ACC2WLM1_9TREE|nr:hypothetical protein QFC20_002294 [Naganishia adeliensis]